MSSKEKLDHLRKLLRECETYEAQVKIQQQIQKLKQDDK